MKRDVWLDYDDLERCYDNFMKKPALGFVKSAAKVASFERFLIILIEFSKISQDIQLWKHLNPNPIGTFCWNVMYDWIGMN